ncbi:MAG: hypothetical protein WCY11_07930 [Novosphingobium sp.]
MRQVKTRMMDLYGKPALDTRIAAALDWWRLAGVDCDFRDEPQNWIAPPTNDAGPAKPVPIPIAAPPPPPQEPGFALEEMPRELPAFVAWWLAEPSLDGGRTSGRVAPRGNAGAELMVVVADPEADDADALLSGPCGRMLDTMVRAMGIEQADVYRASALPRRTPHADWDLLHRQGIGKVLERHVELAAPRRLIVFGNNILPRTDNGPPLSAPELSHFNLGENSIPLLVERDLASISGRAPWKARFWQRWLGWA